MGRCTYYSVDIEASGPVPGLFNLLSLGVTVVRPGSAGLEVGESLYLEFRPVFAGNDPGANAVHGLDLDRLQREGLEPAEALRRLSEFVERTQVPGTAPTFVGHVAVFDWMYLAWYYAWCGLRNPFGYKGLDTKSLAMGVLKVPWWDTGKETLIPALGMEAQAEETVHRADADARHQAEILVALLKRAGIPD